MPRILLAEDDEIMRVTTYDQLVKCGWEVDQAEDGRQALALVEQNHYHLILTDIRMPRLDGIALLKEVLRLSPETAVVLMTAFGRVEDAIACLKNGAADYVLKPFDMDDLIIRVRRLIEMQRIKLRCTSLEERLGARQRIIGSCATTRNLLDMIARVAATDSTVLVTGESGTGKELVAAAIHYGGPRAKGPYIRVNCAAIPEGLMESELFGHEKGSFTGAVGRRTGRFEQADGGTLLLDEIGEMPMGLQAKLLRVLQEREIERVGGTRTIKIDVRIICATGKNLALEVRNGVFREDLFYRLQVIPVEVPPLRARKEDIPELSRYFLDEFSGDLKRTLKITANTLRILMAYDYPGNIRELRNILERVSVLASGPVIEPWDLPADLVGQGNRQRVFPGGRLAEVLAHAEKECLMQALAASGGNRTEAAKNLGISRKNLWEKLKLHNI